MSKNTIIKIVILLIVAALVYSVFWFFKVGQLEKQVRNFIDENGAYVSSGSIAVSGFPLAQKLTINDLVFSAPTSLLAETKVTIKSLEAKSKIFSNSFSAQISKEISLQDTQGNIMNLEMNSDPEILFSVKEGKLENFSYKDSGYRILNAEKQAIYTASSSSLNFSSNQESGEKISNKIALDIKDIQGFDLGDFYKNAFEKKVIEGIKTGEITIGNNNTPTLSEPVPTTAEANTNNQIANPSTTTTQPESVNPEVPAQAVAADASKDLSAAVTTDLVKNNFKMEIEYILTPNKNEQPAQASSDPTQIQDLPVQYTKTVKFNSFEFSNPMYKITLNGELTFANDDNMPYGSASFIVEKADNLISYISSYINKIIEEKKASGSLSNTSPVANLAADPNSIPTENLANPQVAATTESSQLTQTQIDSSYTDFLSKFVAKMAPVAKEIGAKNAVTKGEISQFDLRREKNLEFLINETPTREILGKF